MFFRNATMFRFPPMFDNNMAKRAAFDLLRDQQLKPVGPLEMASTGWVPLFAGAEAPSKENDLCIGYWTVEDQAMLVLGSEERMLPTYVVNDLLAKKLAEVERNEGRKPGGRARKRMKEDLVHELLPRAFVKPGRLYGYLDFNLGVLFVDTASRKQAEGFVSQIRHGWGSFPALPMNAEVAPRAVMTGWVAGEPLPDGLTLGEEAVLEDASDQGARIAATRQELGGDEIARHLESGKQVTRLALVLNDHISFTLGEDLTLRKIKFLDGALDSLGNDSSDDLQQEIDARLALMTAEFAILFHTLGGALKFSRAGA